MTTLSKCSVYWIRAPHHSDMFSEGYIGVSVNAYKRWNYGHFWAQKNQRHDNTVMARAIEKYGWDNLIKEIVLVADERYCYDIESKLRSEENVGWNLCIGGTKPPKSKSRGENYVSPLKGKKRETPWLFGVIAHNRGKKASEETKAKLSAIHKGRKQTPEQIAKRVASRKATLAAQGRTR